MAGTGDTARAPFRFLIDDVALQRETARELMGEADAIARLLESDVAALGSAEIAFLARLRAVLLGHARGLGENASLTSARAVRALERDQE